LPVKTVREALVSWIIIDREDKGNSFDLEHMKLLQEALARECGNEETVLIAVTGSGDRFFSTGVDLESTASIEGLDDAWRLFYEGLGSLCRAIVSCEKPVALAINGHAIGIGMELLVAADFAYAVKNAKFSSPAVRWGMVPPGTTTMGPFFFGPRNAAMIALTGASFTAEEALAMNLLNGVVDGRDELKERIHWLAGQLAKADPWALRQARRLIASARMEMLIDRGLRALAESAARPVVAEKTRGFLRGRRAVD